MSLRFFTVLGALAAAAFAQAQPAASPSPSPSPRPTAQQMFDAGQAAFEARKFAEAERTFGALEIRLAAAARPQERSIAVARLRRGQALARMGEDARAGELLLAAIPALDKPADAGLRGEALGDLGRLEERQLDLPAAAAHYRAALALLPTDAEIDRVSTRMRIARTAMFDDPARVAADLQAGLPEAEKALAADPRATAQYWDLYGRALLNAQSIKPARAALKKALALSGGLTLKVSIGSLETRGDAAIAAEFDHDDRGAAELLSYTGAGQSAKISLQMAPDFDPPACGEAIHPDDIAVVQFTLSNDGMVSVAVPIYASRPGSMAIEFARAVSHWRWSPRSAAAIDPFFRIAPRIELRCTTRADRISADSLLQPYVREWLDVRMPSDPPRKTHGADWVQFLRKSVTEAERAPTPNAPRLVALIEALAHEPEVDAIERQRLHARAFTLAVDANAPPAVRAMLAVKRTAEVGGEGWESKARRRAAALGALADDPAYAADGRVRAWLRLMTAEQLAKIRHLLDARGILEIIVASPSDGFPVDDPIRSAAAIRLASLQTATGARDAAAVTFAKSGLDPTQCALLDEKPLVLSRSFSANDYPVVARSLGFEGWAVTEFDVTNNGRTANQRALIVYPPFLFGPAAASIVRRTTYRPTFRPDGALSCGGYRDRVKFARPY